jgi:UDP-N-acetylmuramoylalanine--D-glutamate ligase
MRPVIDLKNRHVLVVGLARTGIAVALFCSAYGAQVTAIDDRTADQLADLTRLIEEGIVLTLGGGHPEAFMDQDLIVISPGVPANLPELQLARARGIPVWSEIELAFRFFHGKLIAITGSNGKTTTTALVGHILESAGIPTLVGGNIGTPLLARAEYSTDSTVTVAEVSSFQLETIDQFRPEIGVLLNLTPDHLDRHETLDQYAAAKMRMFENQTESDTAILNADDLEVAKRTPCRPKIYWFSRTKRVANGAFVRDGQIILRDDGREEPVMRREEIPLRGEHNVENVMAGCLAARLAGAETAAIANGVRTFPGVEHRIEFAGNVRGISFYNDSKATNVDATLKAISAFDSPLLLILGGRDKGAPYTPLLETLRQRARAVLLIGEATDKIASELGGEVPLKIAGTLDRAVPMAFETARPGDVVLLAPACSSYDQFENYEQRGRAFKQLVAQIARRIESQSRSESRAQSHANELDETGTGIAPRFQQSVPGTAEQKSSEQTSDSQTEDQPNPPKGRNAANTSTGS